MTKKINISDMTGDELVAYCRGLAAADPSALTAAELETLAVYEHWLDIASIRTSSKVLPLTLAQLLTQAQLATRLADEKRRARRRELSQQLLRDAGLTPSAEPDEGEPK